MSERVDPSHASPTDVLRDARPEVDALNMAAVRERTEKLLFGKAAPARFGRYVLLGDCVDGGMGVVYSAQDPELQRKVALKVLHPRRQLDDHAHQRLIVEARALAKLDHPNVVKVHDVITQDGRVVIVMEWVAGQTLAVWQRAQPRSCHDVIAIYAQAGQGLAAAHSVGVIHRDFKPSNAIVGDGGRVRVLDFGLARPTASELTPEVAAVPDEADSASWADTLTLTGAMVGTVAYAAPEQIDGGGATPESDQFSFAVSLHQALEGVPPFAGETPDALAQHIRTGRIATATDGRAVPKWLRSIVARGLAAEPAARFPSMAALLAELTRPRGWRRWRTPLLIAALAMIAALALIIRPTSDPAAECDGGVAQISRVWNPGERARIAAALHPIYAPDAAPLQARLLRSLDGYRDRWIELSQDACIAHRRGEQSAALLDRRTICLQKHLSDLRATTAVIEQLDAASASNAINAIASMPSIEECGDIVSLQSDTAPPDAAQRPAVEVARADISRAMALDRAGRSTDALAIARTAVDEADHSGYSPIVAEAALAQGRIILAREDFAPAIAAFSRARAVALENHQFAIAVEAAARKLFAEGKMKPDTAALQRDADVFIPISKGLAADHFAGPLLLNNIGVVYMATGDRSAATRYFQQARDRLNDVAGGPDLELAFIDLNLAMVTSDAAKREALARGVWQRFRQELGESHLLTLEALEAYARYVVEPATALPLLSQACNSYRQYHAELVGQRVYCDSYRAFLAGELADHAEELRLYGEMSAFASTPEDDMDTAARASLAAGYARLLRHDARGALAALTKIIDTESPSPYLWVRVLAANAELGAGLAQHALGNDRDAAMSIERALVIYRDAVLLNEEMEFRLRIAVAERALAEIRR